jgi:hypothetical protein
MPAALPKKREQKTLGRRIDFQLLGIYYGDACHVSQEKISIIPEAQISEPISET